MSSIATLAAACGTLALLPPGPAAEPVPSAHVEVREDGKLLRDAYGGNTEVAVSKNFALKWGPQEPVSDSAVGILLEQMERGWEVEMDQLGHPSPVGTDDYLFNVYIGDSGAGAPDSYGVNYFSQDADGWPMIVLHPGNLDDPTAAGPTVAHELYHAIQHRTGAYVYWDLEDPRAWYWEATASWVMGEVFPEDAGQAGLLYGYAFFPQLSVHHFEYATADGGIEQLHQYGAFIFLRYLTEQIADPSIVRDSWVQAGPYDLPLEELDDLLGDLDADLGIDEVFPGFAAAAATWDYQLGEMYESWLDYVADYYPGDDHRVADTVQGDGTYGWEEADEDLQPEELGYNIIEFRSPDEGAYEVGLDGETDVPWALVVVVETDEGAAYHPIEVEDGFGMDVVEVPDDASMYLAVSVLTTGGPVGQSHGYSYRIDLVEEEVGPDNPEPEGPEGPGGGLSGSGDGCSCEATGGSAAGLLASLVMLPAVLRRRR
jgi:MYXO-CTERM domain-containing protein